MAAELNYIERRVKKKRLTDKRQYDGQQGRGRKAHSHVEFQSLQ